MHELSIALSIIDLAEKEARSAGSTRITEVQIEIGQLAGVDREALEFSLEMARQKTMMSNAKIAIETIPGIAFCNQCQSSFRTIELIPSCPDCDSLTHLVNGTELKLKSILVD